MLTWPRPDHPDESLEKLISLCKVSRSARESTMSELRSKIKEIRRRNASRHWYVPEALFLQVATDDLIRQVLVEAPSYEREQIVLRISQQGKKIFGILVVLGLEARVSKFIEANELQDEKLPFRHEVLTEDIRLPEDEAGDFHERQWEFAAPAFFHGTLHRNLADNIVMPFVRDEEIGHGSFGQVYEVTLDPDHQSDDALFPRVFARKEFKLDRNPSANRSVLSHRRELKNLAILSRLNHPNIVALLGSYTHNGKHNLLFEMATDGNLAGLLAAPRSLPYASDEVLVIALARLSSAIEHVHEYTGQKIDLSLIGCHHDLRPRNILVTGPNFILADFGLSTFKSPTQNSATPFKPTTDDYLAPECEDWENMFNAGTVHRSSDIWSFGCIIAEVATYMALGCSGVEAFQNARRYKIRGFELYSFHQGTGPSTAVEDWLTKLQDSSTQTCILLVLLARKLLQMDQLKRPTATEVTLLLRRAALCAVAITVQDLFRRIRAAADSIDLYLEAVKFESWRYAIGIMNVEDAVQPRSAQRCDMSQFDAILDALFALRRDLESRTSTDRTQRVTMSQLLRLNNDLYLFLGRTDRDAFHEYFNLTVAERDDEIFQPSERMEMGIIVDEEIRMRATIRHINKLLDSGSVSNSDEMRVELSHVLLRQRFGQHHIAQFTGDQKSRPVWVEWRGYGRHGVDEEVQAQLYRRTAKLAELLSQEKPPTLRTLDCCGFFHDPTRVAFGLIFDIPSASTSWDSFEPVSLFDIIEASTDRLSRSPDLDDKFDLATSLATSLLELHTVGWFHKGLTSSNIVFFSEKGTQKHSIREPFLVGFNHSRSDEHNTFTTGLTDSSSKDYQHPRYIKESFGYRHEFDYYSLGIILMEIGFWKPLNQLVSSPKYLNMSYEQRRQSLLTYRVPHLKQYMGREFYQAVKWCIEGDTGISDTQESRDKAVPLAFQEQVVSRLRGRFMTNAKRD